MTASIRWSEVTALYGGSFDPPHIGHRLAAEGLLRDPGVKRIVILPAGRPPGKAPLLAPRERLLLARTAFASSPATVVSDLEIRRAETEAGPTFAFESLVALRASEAGGESRRMAFALGADLIPGLPRWHRFPELFALCHWIVIARRGAETHAARETLRNLEESGLLRSAREAGLRVHWAETEAPALSSTLIRETWEREGVFPAETLDPAVEAAWRALPGRAKRGPA